jgi:lipid-A-disaccharide synthase
MVQGRPDDSSRPLRIALIAGEASGDVLGASLIKALAALSPEAEFFGIGGPKMIAAGLVSAFDQEKLAVRGAVEVIKHLPEILSIRRGILAQLKAWQPDVMVGIDAPDFNLPIERQLKRGGIPTVHYVSPTVWAWRRDRAKRIVAAVNQLLCLFPFEPACYKEQGLDPVFIGHPLADEIPADIDRVQQRAALDLPEAAPLVTLMPGSRQSELDFHAQLFVETANRIAAELPESLFVVPLATPVTRARFEEALRQFGAKYLRVRILFGHAREALAASDLALVCSGTATLEAALLHCPMIITYRISALSAWIYKKMRYLPWVGLPNILLGRLLVPELLQEEATAEKLSSAMIDLWRSPSRRAEMSREFGVIHQKLRQDSAARAAEAVLACVRK